MKKFINDVWTVQLPRQEINISSEVPEADIINFTKGKGEWGENALYINRKDTFTVFDTVGEAQNYVNYTKPWDQSSFSELINNASSIQELNGIVTYVNSYKDDLVMAEGLIPVPETPSTENLVAIATYLDSNYENLTETEQQALITEAESMYNFITGLF